MSSAYIIANVEVTNPTQYEEYKKWSTVAMQAHGAEVCVRGGKAKGQVHREPHHRHRQTHDLSIAMPGGASIRGVARPGRPGQAGA